jgi:RNA polymerase sigma-70 factor (ECF subfamily)
MDTDYQDDMTLARRVAQGETNAFEEFYARHADLVFAFVLHRVNGLRPDAEEIWQDTLVAAIRALPAYQGESRLSSWLCGIARRKIADHWRRSARMVQTVTAVAPDDLLQLMDGGALPAALLNQDATRARVVEALAELPADYRDALIARYADGDSVEEVAHRLGRTYKATESLLSRAKAALREALARI